MLDITARRAHPDHPAQRVVEPHHVSDFERLDRGFLFFRCTRDQFFGQRHAGHFDVLVLPYQVREESAGVGDDAVLREALHVPEALGDELDGVAVLHDRLECSR